jgi:hypothetical protein
MLVSVATPTATSTTRGREAKPRYRAKRMPFTRMPGSRALAAERPS